MSEFSLGNQTNLPSVIAPTATIAGLSGPNNLAIDTQNNLFVSYGGDLVSEIAPSGSPTAGGVTIRSSLETRPMSIGDTTDTVDGINLTNAELAQIATTSSGTLTIGDVNQTGNITINTATPVTTPGATLNVIGPNEYDSSELETDVSGDCGGGEQRRAGNRELRERNPGRRKRPSQ